MGSLGSRLSAGLGEGSIRQWSWYHHEGSHSGKRGSKCSPVITGNLENAAQSEPQALGWVGRWVQAQASMF